MLEGMYQQSTCQPPWATAAPPAHHPSTSGYACWHSLHLCKVQGQGYDKMAQCYAESRDFSKRQFVPLPDTGSGCILHCLMMYWIEAKGILWSSRYRILLTSA